MPNTTPRARRIFRAGMLISSALTGFAGVARAQAGPDISEVKPAVVVTPPATPGSAVDPVNITGVGQMVVDEKNGFLGLCTGTLINPRTVIFAAHCVNENPAGTGFQDPRGYGAQFGGLPIAFAFNANNNQAGNSAIGKYLSGALKYQSNPANFLYNVNQVVYNPDSTKLGISSNFLQGDVALATLDKPVKNVPTWTILLSQLPAPSAISNTTGTGYHVVVDGYGTNGVGPTGAVGQIDYRRRLAENYLGLLGSLDDQDNFLFGAKDGLPQNLYQIDFDSPGRSNRYDFNVFKDNALPNEGTVGPGDSGGPLILDKSFAKPTVIGVLSGSDRFFNAQPNNAYGTTAFYQPLYLFWDYIAANNPYRYASAVAGDGAWTDPTHWITNLDPAYQIIVGGQLVNGVPTTTGDGITGTSGKFGQVCFQSTGSDDCLDIRTNKEYVNGVAINDAQQPAAAQGTQVVAQVAIAADPTANSATVSAITTGGVANGRGINSTLSADNAKVSATSLGADETSAASGTQTTQVQSVAAALPLPTLANGLPGATNFVPNNLDPNAVARTSARYYDVNLSATGTTTLSSVVAVDHLSITGGGAKLTVDPGAALVALMEIDQAAGLVTNNGTVTTQGDYFLMSGGVQGTGRFNQGFFTSAAGMIAPGTLGTVGTLTFGGNLILASGNILLVDLGPGKASDLVSVVAGSGQPGAANVGGTVGFAPVAGTTVRYNDLYTILTATGGVTGSFAAPASLSAILTPKFIYQTNAVQVQIAAGLYRNVVSGASPVQVAYANLLDANRAGSYNNLSTLYGPLDLQSAATIQATLDSWAPRDKTLGASIGTVALDNMDRFYRERVAVMGGADGGMGALTMVGQPVQLAAAAAIGLPGQAQVANDSPPTMQTAAKLPDNVAAYLAGGYLNGRSRPMSTAVPMGGRDRFDGYYLAGGIEAAVDPRSTVGLALSYTELSGTTSQAGQQARGQLFQGALYGKFVGERHVSLDLLATAGEFDLRTVRGASLVGTDYTLTARDRALALTGELGVAADLSHSSITFGPRVAVRASRIGFTRTAETGGPMALAYNLRDYDSVEGRAGVQLGGGDRIKPYLSAYYVHDFLDRPGAFLANFTGGLGAGALFALNAQDHDWGEVSGGLTVRTNNVELSVAADTTVARKDVSNQSYRAAVKFHF